MPFTSNSIERILHQLSKAVLSAISSADDRREHIPSVLGDLIKLETRPEILTNIAYEWCSVMYENREDFEGWESLLLNFLKIGFRHLNPHNPHIEPPLAHTEHHQGLVDVVFKSQESEVIADLLHAWTTEGRPTHALLRACVGHLVGLHDLVPFSSRLQLLIMRSVKLIGCKGFEEVGVERLVELLNHLRVAVEDMKDSPGCVELLVAILQTSEGVQRLSPRYWELLVELAISLPQLGRNGLHYSSQITTSIIEAQEWNKLECWMGVVSILWPPEADGIPSDDLECSIHLLLQKRPGAAQKLEQWMKQWCQQCEGNIPESFQRTLRQETAQRDPP